MNKYPHQEGQWTLTAPDGRTWMADSPLRVVSQEQRSRIPASVAMERIEAGLNEKPPYGVQLHANRNAVAVAEFIRDYDVDDYDVDRRTIWADLIQDLLCDTNFVESFVAGQKAVAWLPDDEFCIETMNAENLRGYDYGCLASNVAVARIIDGTDTGEGVANEPWESLRRRLLQVVRVAPFDADDPRFREAFEDTVKANNYPLKRKGEGYASTYTDAAFRLAFGVVNRLQLKGTS